MTEREVHVPDPMAIEACLKQLWPGMWGLVDGVLINDDEGRYVYVSPAYARLVGYEPEELLGESFLKVVPPEFLTLFHEFYERAIRGGGTGQTGEFQLQRKDGQRITVWTLHCVLTLEGRRLQGFLVRDVTRQRQLEHTLLHADRVRMLGTLAGSVAHEFNNLLVSILGYAEMIERARPLDESLARDYAAKIQRAATRGTELTAQLLPFARREVEERQVDLHDVLRHAASAVFVGAAVELELAAQRPLVLGDPTQLHQVFLNLLRNARTAMFEGSSLHITTRAVQVPQGGRAAEELPITPASYVLVTVDSVEHTPLDLAPRRAIDAAALGMALVHSSVESHGGWVEVDRLAAGRCSVRVWLPQAT
jgi:two-component system, cell cycle sensor histidine kinase and response regulator CckA